MSIDWKRGVVMNNCDIRNYAKRKKVYLWMVSEKLGYSHETVFSRVLRHELPQKEKDEIFRAIDEIQREISEKKVDLL